MTNSRTSSSKWCGVLILCWLILTGGLLQAELHIINSLWGFDGKVLPGRSALLTVEVENRDDREFSGEIILKSGRNGISQSGAVHSHEIYLSPGQRRWIQFHPYIKDIHNTHRLTWRGGEFDLNNPDFGPPATVLLADTDGLSASGARMRIFPENAFPASLAALSQLHAVAMDHVPRWDAVRRAAFLDWIKSGGTVHLLQGIDGKCPVFPEDLAALNEDKKPLQIGLGSVVFHNTPRHEFSEETLAGAGYPVAALQVKEGQPNTYYQDLNQGLLQKLSELSKADIAWHYIFVLTLFYIALIGPVYFIWRKKDYRFILALFLGSVVFFSVTFMTIGRRGYGESQVIHTLTLAKVMEPGRCNVTQWVNAFATKGGVYTFQHPSKSGYYATTDQQSIPGQVQEGKESAYLADIPLFSSQAFMFQSVMKCSTPDVQITKWETTGSAPEFELTIPPMNPGNIPTHVIVRHMDQFRELKKETDSLWTSSLPAQNADVIMSRDKLQQLDMWNYRRQKQPTTDLMDSLWPALMACAENRDLSFAKGETLEHRPLPAGILRVYIYTKSTQDLNPTAKGFASAPGNVLYVIDLPVPQP